ncbi:MAG: (d)CMP kinase [Planctomycetota bacterium]|nr:(d)CMP kinase [Planctomycetota bacterium]MDA1178678.1 (d)CMP kinase [Planctomycetota bacterium]
MDGGGSVLDVIVVTIDGPAGAGKSTVARELARRLGFQFLDTGAMYRAVALAAIRAKIDIRSADLLSNLVSQLDVRLNEDQVFLNGENVTSLIRTWEVTNIVSLVADNQDVRNRLVEWQRAAVQHLPTITEGRDQGTVVFPQARCKFFLTASATERAKRRWSDLQERGQDYNFEEVLTHQELRDERDRTRPFGSLIPATDAIHIDTDGLEIIQVVEILESWIRKSVSEPH